MIATQPPEEDAAIILANEVLDRCLENYDDDLPVLARQLLRRQERIEALEAALQAALKATGVAMEALDKIACVTTYPTKVARDALAKIKGDGK